MYSRFAVLIAFASVASAQLLDLTNDLPALANVITLPLPTAATARTLGLSVAVPLPSTVLSALPSSGALIGFKPNNASAAQWISLSDFANVLVNRLLSEQTANELINTARNAVAHIEILAGPENTTAARNYFTGRYGYSPQSTGEKVESWVEHMLQQSADNLHGKGMLDSVARELDSANDAVRQMAALRFTVEHANVISNFVRRYNLEQKLKQKLYNHTEPTSLSDMYVSFKDYVRVKRQAEETPPAEPAAEGEPSGLTGALSSLDSTVSGAIGSVVGGVGGVMGTIGGGLATGISAIPGGETVLNAAGAVVSTFTGGFWQVLEIGVLIVDQFVLSFTKIDALFKPIKQLASMAFPPIGLVFDSISTLECFWNTKAKLFQMESFSDFFSFLSCGMNYLNMFKKGLGMIG